MLILTYLRAKKMSKRQKEMEWEKEEIARIEREINEKSAEEVELELRGKMGKERQRRAETEKSWSGQEEQEEIGQTRMMIQTYMTVLQRYMMCRRKKTDSRIMRRNKNELGVTY